MKATLITLFTSLFFCSTVFPLAAQALEPIEKCYNHYFKKHDLDWTQVQNDFDLYLQSLDLPGAPQDKPALYLHYLKQIRTIPAIPRTAKTDALVAAFSKLGSPYPEKGKVWWYDCWQENRINNTAALGQFKYALKQLQRRMVEGRVGTHERARILADGLNAKLLEEPTLQQIVVILVFANTLPSAKQEMADKALLEIERKLDIWMEDNNIEWQFVQGTFDAMLKKEYVVISEELRGTAYWNYLGQAATSFSATVAIERNEAWDQIEQTFVKSTYFTDGGVDYQVLKNAYEPIHATYKDNLEKYHPILSVMEILNVLQDMPDINPVIIYGGLRLTYSEEDLDQSVHTKTLLLLILDKLLGRVSAQKDDPRSDSLGEDIEMIAPILPPSESELQSHEVIFSIVEKMPQFPGGDGKMMRFFSENLVYPAEAKANNIQGLVVVTFVVDTDGSLQDVKVLRDIGGGCGEEAIRVIRSMPTWVPGEMKGRPVRVQYNLPVRFKSR